MITMPLQDNELISYFYKSIHNWYTHNEGAILNVVTMPYNSSLIFVRFITELIKNGKKVLYITSMAEKDIELLNYIKDNRVIKEYSYLKTSNSYADTALVFASQEIAMKLNESFSLIIYDDIGGYSSYSRIEVQEQLNYLYKFTEKIITFSIEPIFINSKVIDIPFLKGSYPLREPRFITTRIDLNSDIPYMMYDYLKWFIAQRRKVLIYTPSSESSEKVYKYLLSLKDNLDTIIQRFYGDKNDKNINYLLKSRDNSVIVVANDFDDYFRDIRGLDIILYSADSMIFDYKKIVYFCGKVGLHNEQNQGEVLLFANEVTLDMEKAKDITRRFNKIAWERGFLS